MKDDQVLQALRVLAEDDRELEAPPEVEARLLREFRSRRSRHSWHWPAVAALAAGVTLAAFLIANRAPKRPVSTPPRVSTVVEVARPAPPPPVVAMSPPRVARKMAAVRQTETREVVTDFFPLMNPAPSFERGQMLRVQLPAAAMQTVGLPVREDHLADLIQADVLVGEEGMPRAIRFVRFDVK